MRIFGRVIHLPNWMSSKHVWSFDRFRFDALLAGFFPPSKMFSKLIGSILCCEFLTIMTNVCDALALCSNKALEFLPTHVCHYGSLSRTPHLIGTQSSGQGPGNWPQLDSKTIALVILWWLGTLCLKEKIESWAKDIHNDIPPQLY